jgi:hypothetical protein
VIAREPEETRRYGVERLIPSNALPARIAGPLRIRAPERIQQPARRGTQAPAPPYPSHTAWPVGCYGSWQEPTNAPSAIVAFAPHFDTHNGQNVETCFVTCVLAIGPPSGVQSPFKYRLHARMTTTA